MSERMTPAAILRSRAESARENAGLQEDAAEKSEQHAKECRARAEAAWDLAAACDDAATKLEAQDRD